MRVYVLRLLHIQQMLLWGLVTFGNFSSSLSLSLCYLWKLFFLSLSRIETNIAHLHQLEGNLERDFGKMGRAPCCDKNGLKKGPWTPEEDQKLMDYIQKHGRGSWRTLPKNAGKWSIFFIFISKLSSFNVSKIWSSCVNRVVRVFIVELGFHGYMGHYGSMVWLQRIKCLNNAKGLQLILVSMMVVSVERS